MTLRLATKLMIHIDAVPRRVLFQHDAPEYAARYAATFRCPIEFGREHNAIVCDRKYLDIAQPFADPTLHNLYVAAAERMLLEIDSGSRTLGDRIRQLLQQEIELASVDGPRLAPRLGLTARQLRRKLAKEGLSLTSLVDEGRRTFACEELRHGRSIEDVATRLGFSERSAFHRAFKRWTGETPRAYLHRQGQPSWRALV